MRHYEQQAPSGTQNGNGPNYVLGLLKRFNVPLTRENYLELAYPEGVPEDLDEASLPAEIRQG